jgi:preprotein translocase subunit SecG
MKTKLRRFTAVLPAMLCMICCVLSAVPAFADDTVTKNDLSSVKWSYVDSPLKIPHFQEVYDNFKSVISKTYNYIAVYGKKSDGTSETNILYFDPTAIAYYSFTNNQFLFGSNYAYDSQRFLFKFDSSDNKTESVGYGGWNVTKPSGFTKSECNGLLNLNDYVQSTVKVYFHTKVYDFDNIENELEPPDLNAPIVPFSVQYSRKLTTGMSRSGTLSAPGAKNDGETITNNNIDITVKLTDEYKQAMQKALDKDPKATQYTYQYVLFITPYDPNIFGTKKAMDGAIYTYLNKSKYVLSTAYGKTKSNTTTDSKYDTVSTPDSSSTDTSSSNVGEMTSENADGVANSAFCNGVTPLFGLPIANGANMTNTHTINLENIKGVDKLGEQDILYIVVVGKRYLYETGAEGYAKDFYANNAEFKTFYKELPDNAVASKINGLYGGNGYDFYTVVSDGFSFKDYPDYKPLEINGVEYPTDKPISDMLDDPFPPSKITDYDGLENGTDFDTKEDFDDYINNKKYDEQYGTFNFNLTDISSIFDGSSDFFKFMTASIGILPPIFITILIAFFTIMLAICLVKWVVK